jgi:hypothetical protein
MFLEFVKCKPRDLPPVAGLSRSTARKGVEAAEATTGS